MSRIHEALKKAELERTAAQQTQVTGPRPNPQPNTSQEERSTATAVVADVLAQANVHPAEVEGPLQLDDLKARCAHPAWKPDLKVSVFMSSTMDANVTEQFRTLRSRLNQLRTAQPLRTLLITSPLAGEGKTFVANNLAHAIVRQGNRSTLIIDADLRRSNLHTHVGAPLTPGLSDYLRGQAGEMKVIQHGQEGNLFFIPGGTPVSNPSELLSNGRLKTLLDRVSAAFDWVILDSPPCLPVADATALADLCDGLLLVVRAGSTPASVAQRAVRELRGRKILGVVLNAADSSLQYAPYYTAALYGNNYVHNGKQKSSVKQ